MFGSSSWSISSGVLELSTGSSSSEEISGVSMVRSLLVLTWALTASTWNSWYFSSDRTILSMVKAKFSSPVFLNFKIAISKDPLTGSAKYNSKSEEVVSPCHVSRLVILTILASPW